MRHSRFVLLLLSVSLVGLGACGSDGTGPDTQAPASLTITPTTVTLDFLGATFPLVAVIRNQSGAQLTGTVTWTTDNPGVATVDAGGTVTATGNGVATVTASSEGLTATVQVTVDQLVIVIDVVAGDGQSATVGRELPENTVVQADDAGGSPVEGAALTFEASSGALSATGATTDAQGRAAVSWTLGTVSGEQGIRVTVDGSAASTRVVARALADAPAAFVKVSGDGQVGPVGQPLDDSVVVRIEDQHGNGVPGGEVSFTVTSGGGSVSPAVATTGDDGTARTSWTMGTDIAGASLNASTPGLPTLEFIATSTVAQPDLVAGDVTVAPAAPTTLETVTVTVPVWNQGSAGTEAAFGVRLLVNGTEAASQTVGPLARGDTVAVDFNIAALEAPSSALRAEVDPDGSIAETDESNNTAIKIVAVANQQALQAGVPVPNVGAAEGVELFFAFELPAEDGSIAFRLSGGTGDADMYVHRGERPASRDDYECISGAADSNEECRINAALPGMYHVLIHAFTTFSGTTLEVVTGLEVLPFNIEVVFIHSGTASQNQAFVVAANRWERVIPLDIRDIPFQNQPVEADQCIEGQPVINDTVDDLRIFVDIITIDGPGGTLGRAAPCFIRTVGGLPIIGLMQFDTDDVANLESDGRLTSVILHEMGHVLGIGTIWERAGLLKEPSIGNAGADTHFDGPLAIEAFDAAGGALYTAGAKVPVENTGEEGSADGHWRESVMNQELMTPFLSIGENPLTAISVQSLADLGYRVDVDFADPWNGVVSAPPRVAGEAREVIDLRGDVLRGPVFEVDATGRVVRVRRR